jgi:hypothetical protein
LTLPMPVPATINIYSNSISGKPHTTTTVTDSNVYPSTGIQRGFDTNNKGKEVSLIEKGFTKSF